MPKVVVESEQIAAARLLAQNARTADELRRAQAVLLPVDFNLTIAQTAQAIGRTVSFTANLRKSFGKSDQLRRAVPLSRMRDKEDAALERERLLLVGVCCATRRHWAP